MRNFKLILSYDGSDFQGWQTQPGYRTVQETLETALATLTGEANGSRQRQRPHRCRRPRARAGRQLLQRD